MASHAETERTNRLAGESSPYLLLHQHNPVDWYPWGAEAIEKARQEDRPIFLSVGYSTCYWCHVMERESFSSPAIAELMNRHFVNVKLDREERPDLDEIYMTATQILSGQGGWPNSVFLTPDLKPFYAGTYFPPTDRYGRPGFASVLEDLATAWRTRRADVEEQAEEMAKAMGRFLEERSKPADEPPRASVARQALESLARRFDPTWGGFGGAPKFPTPSNLYLCLELAGEHPEAGEMLTATLDQMARGGIYDQLAGGFHRYATDREWKIPHFEKMLYDNGFLLELYAREHARTGDPQAARVVRETAEWVAREMTSPEGAFWSAIDAETHGHEGAYYVWTQEELKAALGEEDFTFLAPILGFDGPPFFEGSHYVLHLPERLETVASRRRMAAEQLVRDVEMGKAKLLAARANRDRPLTDDKVLADWNGMLITGLAVAGKLLGERS
ncbi:MAG TPA: thioredoxin domain-containing protein, partial [Thermoanaerobaculia bacterium]|nr:thioredoxin domain-containing protein [Thermoanaerobaculia bacterium]